MGAKRSVAIRHQIKNDQLKATVKIKKDMKGFLGDLKKAGSNDDKIDSVLNKMDRYSDRLGAKASRATGSMKKFYQGKEKTYNKYFEKVMDRFTGA